MRVRIACPALLIGLAQAFPPDEEPAAIDRTADYQAYRSTLWALSSAWRKGEAAAFQALFEELPPGLRSSMRDGLLERACGLSQGSALEGQEAILQALVERWGALPTRLTLQEVARGPGSQATQVLLRRSWQAAKACLDLAAGRGDLAGVRRAIFRGIMPDLTTWAHASLGGQHEILAHLAPYGLSQAELEATAQAWSGSKRALYQTLLLMGAREGQLALIELVEQKAPELLRDKVLLEQALYGAARSAGHAALAPLKAHYDRLGTPFVHLPHLLLTLALESRQLATVQSVFTLFPQGLGHEQPLSFLIAAVKSHQVELLAYLDQRLGYAWSSEAIWAKVSCLPLSLPMLQAIQAAHPDFLASLEKHHLCHLMRWGSNASLLAWLHAERPDLVMHGGEGDHFFTHLLKHADLESVLVAEQMTPGLSLTAQMLTAAFSKAPPDVLAHVMTLPLREALWGEDLKQLLLGAVRYGKVSRVKELLIRYPQALEGIQERDEAGNDWRSLLLWCAIASGNPRRVAWLKPLMDEPWLRRPSRV